MGLTKQHFEMIADIVKTETVNYPEVNKSMCKKFSNQLAWSNPLFDTNRFLNACEVKK